MTTWTHHLTRDVLRHPYLAPSKSNPTIPKGERLCKLDREAFSPGCGMYLSEHYGEVELREEDVAVTQQGRLL